MPLSPPMANMATKASAFSMGVVNRISPCHTVPSQLKVLIAEGSAMNMVETMKVVARRGFMPLWNMWCAHTMNPRPAMAMIEYTMGWYPKIGFLEKTERMSEVMPMAGRIMM